MESKIAASVGTGIILAGGRRSRFGLNKALALWQGKTIIETIVDCVKSVFEQVLVVVKDKKDYAFLKSTVWLVNDLFEEAHALGGIYSGLSHTRSPFSFVCACDMPFLHPTLIRALWDLRNESSQAVVPLWDGYPQPFSAVYSKTCLPKIQQMIDKKNLRVQNLLKHISTQRIETMHSNLVDPNQKIFFDINTPDDYHAVVKTN